MIPLRNLPSNLMAYWLDPLHQQMPMLLQSSLNNEFSRGGLVNDLPRQAGNGKRPLDLKLPAGVSSVVSIDPQNVLLVKGTDAGIEELRKLVALHDAPVNQTEIEAKFVDMPLADLNALKLPLRWTISDAPDTSWPAVGLAPDDMEKQLNALITDGRTRIITAPRMTVVDGLNGQLFSRETRSIELQKTNDVKTARDAMLALEGEWREGLTLVSDETGLRATAVTKGDLIAMDLQAEILGQVTQFSSVVRNGQTLAVLLPQNGDDAPRRRLTPLGDVSLAPQQDVTKNQTVRVVFVTARSIKRAGD